MQEEDYCSFEVAKLLKEKGFKEPVTELNKLLFKEGEKPVLRITHQKAMKWLREKHNILITIIPQEIKVGIDALCYGIYRITEDLYQPLYNGKVNNLVDSYEEAVEAALKFTLENLI